MGISEQYTILGKVAQGGMAEIFKAEKLGLDNCKKTVAIKKIIRPKADSDEFKTMFSEEAKIISLLNHPNIVSFDEYFLYDNDPCIAFEYIEGIDLNELLKENRKANRTLPLEVYLYVITEMLKALDYAHKKQYNNEPLNIIHRDVSPQNILLSYEGFVKLADFGIALGSLPRNETQLGFIKGKDNYFSPEQVNFETITHKIDIYAVGVMLHEYIYGFSPFVLKGMSHDEVANQIRQHKKVSNADPIINVPDELIKIMNKAMAFDPNDRFEDAKSLRLWLLKFLSSEWKEEGADKLKDYLKAYKKEEQLMPFTKVLNVESALSTFSKNKETKLQKVLDVYDGINTRAEKVLNAFIMLLVLIISVPIAYRLYQYKNKQVVVKPAVLENKVEKENSLSGLNLAIENAVLPFEDELNKPKILKKKTSVNFNINKKTKPKQKAQYGFLTINAPNNSEAYINGAPVDLNKKNMKLKYGEYLVAIRSPEGLRYIEKIMIGSGKEYSVNWSPES